MCKNSHFQLHKCLYLFVDYFDFPLWGYDYEIVIHLDSLLLGKHFVSIQRRKLLNRYEQNNLCEKNVHWKA